MFQLMCSYNIYVMTKCIITFLSIIHLSVLAGQASFSQINDAVCAGSEYLCKQSYWMLSGVIQMSA